MLGCASAPQVPASQPCAASPEVEVTLLRLGGLDGVRRRTRVGSRYAEISAMAWHGDTLWLLPQYPERFARPGEEAALLSLSRAEIEAAIAAPERVLTPGRVPMRLGAAATLPGSEGFEALVVEGDALWVTVETTVNERTAGVLLRGQVGADGVVSLDAAVSPHGQLEAPRALPNTGFEALVASPDGVAALFEANGAALGELAPRALLFARDLASPPRAVAMPRIEYRITDATPVDAAGRFWVTQYFFPGDWFLAPAETPAVHTVEALVELQWSPAAITRTARPPTVLRLGHHPRNWEGLVRLGDRGFLLVTDEWPDTLLGFVPR